MNCIKTRSVCFPMRYSKTVLIDICVGGSGAGGWGRRGWGGGLIAEELTHVKVVPN